MGYKFCNGESAVATCDSHNWLDKSKFRRKKNKHHNHNHNHNRVKLRQFNYSELEAATNRFGPRNLLGKGSHGAVFRAVIDNGSLVVAVKRPTTTATLATNNEIDILPKIKNHRIVNLLGYAVSNRIADTGKLLLVVEYMPNGSLYDLIHKNPKLPTWSTRVRMALQIAKAIRTLHTSNPPVIHRDIKSSNILLDHKFNARLSDFGLALQGHVEDVRVMSTPPAGTIGYLDPCYLAPGDLSTKSDVFSFGILLLEIISGRRAIDVNYSPPSILEWALPLIKSGDFYGICDRRIGCMVDRTVIRELALLAVRCVRSTAEKRPCIIDVVDCIKMVYKKVKVSMWSNLRRRVRHVERSKPLDGGDLVGRGRKVSNVTRLEDKFDKINDDFTRVGRRTGRCKSKSIGSFREIKVGPEMGNCEINVNEGGSNNVIKKRAQVTVKLSSVVRLSKSRSMSVLQCSKNEVHLGNKVKNLQVNLLDEFPLLVNSSR